MLTPPEDLDTEELSEVLRDGWRIEEAEVSYAAVGNGTHNWRVAAPGSRRWFLKAYRRNGDSSFFDASYRTAAALHDAGLDFITAPIADREGRLRPGLSDRWELALLPFVEGRNTDFSVSAERAGIASVVGRLHTFGPAPESALRWTPGYLQPELRELLDRELDRPWRSGPHGEPARALLTRHRAGVERLLALAERLADRLAGSGEPWVITHGEPHGGNTMRDEVGATHLIDCDAMMVAPRERDLRLLLHASHRGPRGVDGTEVLAAYRAAAGEVEVRSFVVELFRAEWYMMEICRYATGFFRPHTEYEDMENAWRGLRNYVPAEPNWLEIRA
ncbi:MAG TPA: phosphotransferase [Candidatus Dormibacteraeota bacterium]|nr:phosphotransferase [Candidatus Dormibacteraeota bacterium]